MDFNGEGKGKDRGIHIMKRQRWMVTSGERSAEHIPDLSAVGSG